MSPWNNRTFPKRKPALPARWLSPRRAEDLIQYKSAPPFGQWYLATPLSTSRPISSDGNFFWRLFSEIRRQLLYRPVPEFKEREDGGREAALMDPLLLYTFYSFLLYEWSLYISSEKNYICRLMELLIA